MNTSTRFINTNQYMKMFALSLLKTKPKIGLVFSLTVIVIALIIILIRTFVFVYNTQDTALVYKSKYADRQKHRSEPANKRHLIATLQSIRMHNVTRYQRFSEQSKQLTQNMGQELQLPHTLLLNTIKAHSKSAQPSEAITSAVEPVRQGW
jgi:hypothetical protein